jgi:hypothetical protein
MYTYKNHVIGKDDKGFYIGEIIENGDIIRHKHRISFKGAIELLKRWATRKED